MALKNFNPTSPSRRALVLVDRSELHKGRPVKALVEGHDWAQIGHKTAESTSAAVERDAD